MPGDPVDSAAKATRRMQVISCEVTKSEYAQVIDGLAGWILEDVNAVARSFDVEFTKVCKDSLRRVRSQAVFLARRHGGKRGFRENDQNCGRKI